MELLTVVLVEPPLLERWSVERLPVLDRSILRMGVFELRYCPDTPAAVVMNEAVELAKKFSTEESGKYINGVLSAVGGPSTARLGRSVRDDTGEG